MYCFSRERERESESVCLCVCVCVCVCGEHISRGRTVFANFMFCFQTELDILGDCSGANSANCKIGLLCDATGSTCSKYFTVVVVLDCTIVLNKQLLPGCFDRPDITVMAARA